MARVPYDLPTFQETRQGPESPVSAPRTTIGPNQAGEQLQQSGQNLLRLGVAASDIGEQLQNQIDDLKATQNDALLSDRDREVVDGFTSKTGSQAVFARKDAIDALAKNRQGILDKIDNDVQRQIFVKHAEMRRQAAMGQIENHFREQFKAADIGALDGRRKASIRDAATFDDDETPPPLEQQTPGQPGQDPQGGESAVAQRNGRIFKNTAVLDTEKLADRMGVSSDTKKAMVLETTTQIHSTRIDRFVAEGRADMAKLYLDKALASGEVDPLKAPDLIRVVRLSSVNDEATKLTDGVMGQLAQRPAAADQSEPDPANIVPQGAAILQDLFAQGKITADVRSAALRQLDERQKVAEQALATDNRKTMASVVQFLKANPNTTTLPPALADKVQQRQLDGAVDNFIRGGGQYVTTPEGARLAANMINNREELAKLTPDQVIDQLIGKVAPHELQEVLTHQQVAMGDNRNLQLTTERAQIDQSMALGGFIPPAGMGTKSEMVNAEQALTASTLRTEIYNRAEAFIRTKLDGKRRPTTEEMQVIIDGVLLDKGTVEGSTLTFPTEAVKPFAAMTPAEMKSSRIDFNIADLKQKYPSYTGQWPFAVQTAKIPASYIKKALDATKAMKMPPMSLSEIAENWVMDGRPEK